MVSEPRVLCAIQHTELEPWITLQRDGQAQTWLASPLPEQMSVVYFVGRPLTQAVRYVEVRHEQLRWSRFGKAVIPLDRTLTFPWRRSVPSTAHVDHRGDVDIVHLNVPDMFPLLQWKYLGAYRYFLNETDCDFLYTTTTGSYVRPDKLAGLLVDVPQTGLYAGSIIDAGQRRFISGANRLLSRDVVSFLVLQASKWDRGRIEDLAQGILMESVGVDFYPLPTLNLTSIDDLTGLSDAELRATHHVRIKSPRNREVSDLQIMHALHARVTGLD